MKKTARRVVAITGGTRGIGLAIAERFRQHGDRVAVCSHSPRPRSLPKALWHRRVDVRQRHNVRGFIRAIVSEFGSLDVMINCAGVSRWRAVEAIDESFAREVIDTSVLGTLWGCAAAASILPRGGCIVNVSSLAGKRGSANNSAYCAAKFAVNGMTQALAKELGPRGIRVNAVCPVYVLTDTLLAALNEPDSPTQGQSANRYLTTFTSTQTALGQLPTAADVAEAVFFLASPAASAMTGQCLNVDSGTLPQ